MEQEHAAVWRFGEMNDQDHPAAAVIVALSKRLIRRLGCIASFGQPVMYHRPSAKRPQVFGMSSVSWSGKHARFVIGMSGLSLAWGGVSQQDEHFAACSACCRRDRSGEHVISVTCMSQRGRHGAA
jgi:hypothetical protein